MYLPVPGIEPMSSEFLDKCVNALEVQYLPHKGELSVLVNKNHYIPRRKSGIYWIQVRRAAAAAAAAAVEISLWTR